MSSPVEVTQADRDAAADYYASMAHSKDFVAHCRTGNRRSELAERFARHRIASLASAEAAPPPTPVVPWTSVKQVPRSTMGYGGAMLLSATGECVGIATIFNKSAKVSSAALDDALFATLAAADTKEPNA